jgi:hypothetical protein
MDLLQGWKFKGYKLDVETSCDRSPALKVPKRCAEQRAPLLHSPPPSSFEDFDFIFFFPVERVRGTTPQKHSS